MIRAFGIFFTLLLLCTTSGYSQSNTSSRPSETTKKEEKRKNKKKKKHKLPEIDLSHWKVTIPLGEPKIIEVAPPQILDYATNEVLKPFMYNDSTKGALVFYAYPAQTTTNTKYSRSELREQMVPGSNAVNWTFAQGGNLKVKMAMDEVSRGGNGKYHKVIITQIHGRLSNEQKALIGAKDNNAPPMLKVYWQDGKIRLKTKVLKNTSLGLPEILHEEVWGDDEGFTFKEKVGFGKFTLEVKVEGEKMVVVLNNNEYAVYDDVHIKKWNVFENYFKVGNYLQTRDLGSYAKVRLYKLEVSH